MKSPYTEDKSVNWREMESREKYFNPIIYLDSVILTMLSIYVIIYTSRICYGPYITHESRMITNNDGGNIVVGSQNFGVSSEYF